LPERWILTGLPGVLSGSSGLSLGTPKSYHALHTHASILPNALNQRVGSGSVATLQEWSDKLADMVLAPSVAGLFNLNRR
jgi:hypothetical protein